MNIKHIHFFENCYIMQQEDIERFADTLADGFSQYDLFKYICNEEYNREKMSLFWTTTLSLTPENAICIADSKNINSVLIYIPPKSKEASLFSYLKTGGIKMFIKLGIRSICRLLQFETEAKEIASKYQTENDGYLMAFATRMDKQGQHYGKSLINALLRYLDASGEGCYLETLKAENVELYKHFSFQLKEQKTLKSRNLTLYAMHRSRRI